MPASGGGVTLFAGAAGLGPITYEWYRGEVGDTSRPLSADPISVSQQTANLTQLTAPVTGPTTFWVRAITAGVVVDSQPARVRLRPADYGRLTNVSILTSLTDANDSFTLGCVTGGDGTLGTKQMVLRAAGPSLGALGVAGTLADPKLQLFRGSMLVAENDDWGGAPALGAAMAVVGAFAYASPASRDAAALATFPAGANHSINISGTGAGRVIAELYDAGPGPVEAPTTPRLLNLSVLKNLGEGLTVGFAIGGDSPVKILVRAVGPALADAFNLANVVANPRLALFRGETRIALNDNWDWSGSSAPSDAFRSVGAFPLPSASKDAALLTTLSPGTYTVQVNATGGSGMVLVEVYEVP